MSPDKNNAERQSKKEAVHTSVESFIERKQTEKADAGAREVQSSAEGVQSEVAEVMAGVEKPAEKISERKDRKGDGDVKAVSGGGQADDGSAPAIQIINFVFPDEEIMIKKIRTAVQIQIRQEIKRSKKLQNNLVGGSAHEYNQSIARIRSLKEILAALIHQTVDALKGMYARYFTSEGRRRKESAEAR